MKLIRLSILLALLALLSGCGRQEAGESSALRVNTQVAEPPAAKSAVSNQLAGQQVSLEQANNSQSIAEAMNRKIIRSAELTLEVASPQDVQRKISSSPRAWVGLS